MNIDEILYDLSVVREAMESENLKLKFLKDKMNSLKPLLNIENILKSIDSENINELSNYYQNQINYLESQLVNEELLRLKEKEKKLLIEFQNENNMRKSKMIDNVKVKNIAGGVKKKGIPYSKISKW